MTATEARAPSHAERAATLVAAQRVATLATVARDPAGYPYGSFVTYAMLGADPVFLISRLATHTQNLIADPRASLMVAERESGDPLANARVTLVGDCAAIDAPHDKAREAFLSAHPDASYYADFTDFGFYRLEVRSVRYIGGYGRMSWVQIRDWCTAEPDPLGPHASAIVAHMNDDHADALLAYARAWTRVRGASDVRMTGIDRYGFELSVGTDRGPRPARLSYEPAGIDTVETPEEAREALVRLVQRARADL